VSLTNDTRFAVRALRRRPGAPLLVAGLFALGIALAGGLWAVVDAALLRPLPYPHPERLVVVLESHPQRGLMAVAPANFGDWVDAVDSFEEAAGVLTSDVSVVAAASVPRPDLQVGRAPATSGPQRVAAMRVTSRFFDVIGTQPRLGRGLVADDLETDARAVVISHRLWIGLIGSSPEVLGTTIDVDGEPFTVVGVMPSGFRMPDNPDLWVPWVMTSSEWSERRFHSILGLARLRAGRSPAAAERELATIYSRLEADHPATNREWRARVLDLRTLMLGDANRSLAILGGGVLTVVIVASTNVASLLMAWLPGRRRELFVRLALGATLGRVVRQLVLETLLLGLLGLAGGLIGARLLVHLFGAMTLSTEWQFDFDPRLDLRVVSAIALCFVGVVSVTAAGPSIVAVRRLRGVVPRHRVFARRFTARAAVVAQAAMSLVILTAAAALVLGFLRLTKSAAASDERTLAVEVTLPDARYADNPSTSRLFERLLASVRDRPEVRAVAAASYVPPDQPRGNVRFTIEGRPTPSEALTALPSAVSGSAFAMLKVPLVAGRLLDDRDGPRAPYAGVVSAALARRYWGSENPIGRRIFMVGIEPAVTIVGVVDNVPQPLSIDPRAESVLYLSYRQVPWPYMTMMITPADRAAAAVSALRDELRRLDPALAPGTVRSLNEVRATWLQRPRLRASITSLFAGATLLLTLAGVSARVAYGVASRAHEIAIRLALGATSADVIGALARETAIVMAAGCGVGLALLPLVRMLVARAVPDAPLVSPTVGAAVACALSALGVASGYWPARRAGLIDPARALKSE
jgi:putative ABC transport system permease protein